MNAFTAPRKTNPKQTQSNPISKRSKMNVSSAKIRDYENNLTILKEWYLNCSISPIEHR